ncbi:hypothetical protein XELAEV_18047577mg [Xenopus laevis]|uniref:Uncharacterized protein n=1 Tax=Xenopus laevis TaxID=8355 RepID=A0A974H205_XENLA|nr:hypothetical protein XELAEV_18047577mg [Xenopus laevis]
MYSFSPLDVHLCTEHTTLFSLLAAPLLFLFTNTSFLTQTVSSSSSCISSCGNSLVLPAAILPQFSLYSFSH